MSNPPSRQAGPEQQSVVIPVVREELHIGSREVDTGRGLRVRTTVTEQLAEVDQQLLRQEVSVERVPIDRIVALDEAPATRQEGATLVVPIVEEVLVVEKRLRIKEEVRITRTARPERHVEQVPLRTEHVSVERFDEGGAGTDDGEGSGRGHGAA